MGDSPSKYDKKQYQELYLVAKQVYVLDHGEPNYSPSPELFEQLFFNFKHLASKYYWAEFIPLNMNKYFYSVLGQLKKAQTESMYKALNACIFNDALLELQDQKQYQNSFYLNVSHHSKKKLQSQSNINASVILKQSILFEDEVVNLLNNQQPKFSRSLFRSSILQYENEKPQQLESNVVVMKQALFIQSLPKKTQQQLGFFIEFYKRFAMVIESLVNSASFISLPLRHFELNMKQKKHRKKLQVTRQNDIEFNRKLVQESADAQEKRKIRKYNQKMLLQQISLFTHVYTEFLWNFYNLEKINQTPYSKLVNYQNIYNLMTNVIWNKCQWIGERGWQYQQYLVQLYLKWSSCPKGSQPIPETIINLCVNLPTSPIRYLKQITIIYRQMLKLSKQMTADDLMLAYNRLFYELSLIKKMRRIYRMIQIINSVWKGEKFGEVGYAWITWQAGLQILLKEAKKHTVRNLQRKLMLHKTDSQIMYSKYSEKGSVISSKNGRSNKKFKTQYMNQDY